MPYKVKITLADDTVKELTIGGDLTISLKVDGVVGVAGLGLNTVQARTLLRMFDGLIALFVKENWKSFEMEQE